MFRGRERRRLKKIERQLSSEDPDFAHRMTAPRPITRVVRWMTIWRALGVLALVLGVLALILGQATEFLIAVLTGALLLLYAWRQARKQPP